MTTEEYRQYLSEIYTSKKPHKYHAQATEVDGIRFDSKAEASRYQELKLLERGGIITQLELQPKFPIIVEDTKICAYVADFAYFDRSNNKVVEDVKGVKTDVYKLKKKLFEALYKIPIIEVS